MARRGVLSAGYLLVMAIPSKPHRLWGTPLHLTAESCLLSQIFQGCLHCSQSRR